jgi:putative FmdB family regulatory protein
MPLYDFGCEECGYTEEILTKFSGNAETMLTCPECEKETMKRQVGLSSFQLKGGGWYKDGYTKKSK